jgi:hypothetical protein
MEKVVPIPVPRKEKPGQSSRSKKGKQRHLDPEPERVEGSGVQFPALEDTQLDQFIDEQVDDPLDIEHEQDQPQTSVCAALHLH